MKKTVISLMMMHCLIIQSQFVGLYDSTSHNRFLGNAISMCSVTGNSSSKNYLKPYECGNNSIIELLNLNILAPGFVGKQFYIFNNFIDAMSKDPSLALAPATSTKFSGSGVFMILFGASVYLEDVPELKKTCSTGQFLVGAQLKYNDGNSLACWSQDSICLAPTDTFAIEVSGDADTTVHASSSSDETLVKDAQGIASIQDPGPLENYQQAGGSPRKIRLVKGK